MFTDKAVICRIDDFISRRGGFFLEQAGFYKSRSFAQD